MSLDPTKSLVKDAVALNMLRLDAHLEGVQGYITCLRAALAKIDEELWPKDTLQNDIESIMARLNDIPSRVQAWKKSAAHSGADMWLSHSSESIAKTPRKIN